MTIQYPSPALTEPADPLLIARPVKISLSLALFLSQRTALTLLIRESSTPGSAPVHHIPFSPPPAHIPVHGLLKNFNTIEEFSVKEKKVALFEAEAQKVCPVDIRNHTLLIVQIWDHILTSRDTSSLNRFLLLTFADLKKYQYHYLFAFPAFAAKPAWEIDDHLGWKSATDAFTTEQVRESSLSHIHNF